MNTFIARDTDFPFPETPLSKLHYDCHVSRTTSYQHLPHSSQQNNSCTEIFHCFFFPLAANIREIEILYLFITIPIFLKMDGSSRCHFLFKVIFTDVLVNQHVPRSGLWKGFRGTPRVVVNRPTNRRPNRLPGASMVVTQSAARPLRTTTTCAD